MLCSIVVALQPAFLTRTMLFISAPFHTARANVSANTESFLGGFASRSTLVEKNKTLEKELMLAKIKSDLYDSLRKEYYKTTNTGTTSQKVLSGHV